jgi:alpha-L-fucosidase 2
VVAPGALKFESRTRVLTTGGTVAAIDGKLTVTDADAATLLIASATNYKRYDDITGDPAAAVAATLGAAGEKTYDTLRAAHIAEHQRLFGRVQLDLGRTPAADLPTDQRVHDYSKQADPSLAALHFQFGRYLLISSSRPGAQPANLQGLWNDQLKAPWGGKYTVNINTEMNYWPAQVTNLAETEEPLFRMVSEIANGSGPRTAKRTYGADGWVLHHNTDLWRPSAPIDTAFWGQWPTGGAWLAVQLYDTYRFSGDRAYLEKLYPILKGSAQFFLDTLVAEPEHGWLVTLPSNSPEHEYEKGLTVSYGPTMDMQILRDLFASCIQASTTLGVDADLRKKWTETRAKLAPNQVGHAGQLQEWIKDWDQQSADLKHRHMSPFYGVYPGFDVTPADPKIFEAARVLAKQRDVGGMGWANAWRIGIWARLLDAAEAGRMVDVMLSKWTEANLFDRPQTQLDGNWGYTAGLAEMLLQSHLGEINLLPAMPFDKWPEGSVSGLRARGGLEVDIAWKDGKFTSATLRNVANQAVTRQVRQGTTVTTVTLAPGASVTLDASLHGDQSADHPSRHQRR